MSVLFLPFFLECGFVFLPLGSYCPLFCVWFLTALHFAGLLLPLLRSFTRFLFLTLLCLTFLDTRNQRRRSRRLGLRPRQSPLQLQRQTPRHRQPRLPPAQKRNRAQRPGNVCHGQASGGVYSRATLGGEVGALLRSEVWRWGATTRCLG